MEVVQQRLQVDRVPVYSQKGNSSSSGEKAQDGRVHASVEGDVKKLKPVLRVDRQLSRQGSICNVDKMKMGEPRQ